MLVEVITVIAAKLCAYIARFPKAFRWADLHFPIDCVVHAHFQSRTSASTSTQKKSEPYTWHSEKPQGKTFGCMSPESLWRASIGLSEWYSVSTSKGEVRVGCTGRGWLIAHTYVWTDARITLATLLMQHSGTPTSSLHAVSNLNDSRRRYDDIKLGSSSMISSAFWRMSLLFCSIQFFSIPTLQHISIDCNISSRCPSALPERSD